MTLHVAKECSICLHLSQLVRDGMMQCHGSGEPCELCLNPHDSTNSTKWKDGSELGTERQAGGPLSEPHQASAPGASHAQ